MLSDIDLHGNIIYLHGEVNEQMYATLAKGLSVMYSADYITIMLNTEGGDLYQALAVYDLIQLQQKTVPVKIVCTGPVMSAGSVILCAADERVATKNAQLMIHYGEEHNDSPSLVKHNKYLYKLMVSIIKSRVNVSQRAVASWFTKDTFLTAEDALKYGLITRIAGQ